MRCIASHAINIGCLRAILSRHSALVTLFYMRLEKHVCNAMSRGLLIHEYVEFMFVRWRVRATYATDIDNLYTKERYMHESCELLHYELR